MTFSEYLIKYGIPFTTIKDFESLKDLDSFNRNDEFNCICIRCLKDFPIKLSSLVRNFSRNKFYSCISCSISFALKSQKARDNISSGVKKSWDSSRKEKQSTISKSLWENENFRKNITDLSKNLINDLDFVEKSKEYGLKSVSTDSYKERIASPEYRANLSFAIKNKWTDNSYKEKLFLAVNSSLYKSKMSSSISSKWNDESYRNKVIESQKKLWEDPEFRSKFVITLSKTVTKDTIIELVTQNILDVLNVKYEKQFPVGPYLFDLFLSDEKILIECQGEYWHSLPKSKRKDSSKFTYADEYFPDYKILYLYERDYLNPEIITNKIRNFISNEKTDIEIFDFSFKDIEIKVIDNSIKVGYYSVSESFLRSYHYAGYGRSAKVVYGSYLDGKLIAISKFSPPVRKESATSLGFSHKDILELDRFCIHPNYQKKHFASWFLSRICKIVMKSFKPKCLISFADTTYGHIGTIYKATNWKEVSRVRPDYHYISVDKFAVHKKTLYNHAMSMKMTESEYASKFGYEKVFGKEKIKYIYP